MTEQLITEIQRKMLPYLNNEQLMHLRDAMAETLGGATITYDGSAIPVAACKEKVKPQIGLAARKFGRRGRKRSAAQISHHKVPA